MSPGVVEPDPESRFAVVPEDIALPWLWTQCLNGEQFMLWADQMRRALVVK